ncbi:MAG: bifunctional metallophosphatase/5'-nucleotidase [Thermoanaerobaculia bacterium]|nr:bifunctional metallophosphatase/5'-nucleotidase [Thermoanaerobaculia bacterium]
MMHSKRPSPRSQRCGVLLVLLVALLPWLGGCGTFFDKSVPSDGLWVHYFNDWHGRLEPFTRPGSDHSVGGAGRLFTLIQARRGSATAAGADSVLLVAGDILQGTPLSTVFRGEPDFELLRRMKVDAMSLGNHEFDFGQRNLAERVAQVDFPVLAANVHGPDGAVLTQATAFVDLPRTRRRLGLLGVVTADVPITTHRRNVAGLTFEDPVEAARRELSALREASDYVIIISHCGLAVDRRLAELPGVDLVIGGHDQKLIEPVLDAAPIVQAGEWGEHLGEAHLERLYSGRIRLARNEYLDIDEGIPPDPETVDFVASYRAKLGEELGEELAVAEVRLEGERQSVRTGETNLGNLVADAVRESTGADVALINGGAIRASIEVGVITLEEVVEVLPFDNQLQRSTLTGAELRALLERSTGLLTEGADMGGFLQVSGLRLVVLEGHLVTVQVGGRQLDPDANYVVATTDFLAAGGDGYDTLVDKEWVDSGYQLTDVVVQRLMELERVDARIDGRIDRGPG